MTSPEPYPSLAASLEVNVLRLELIDRAKGNGASWAVIGRTLGMSGREAKRHAHRLRAQVKRAELTGDLPASAPRGNGARARS